MIVLTEESDRLLPSASSRDIKAATEAAKLVGCRVYYIPADFADCGSAKNALSHIPQQPQESLGVWIGYIPSPERYQAIYQAALQKKIRLLNAPEEHLRIQEGDRAYPYLQGLTPKSAIVTNLAQCQQAINQLGLPVFVKGIVQSSKAKGLQACLANSLEELQKLVEQLLLLENHTRGRVLVREFVKLRHTRSSPQGFPLGREYRVFVYRQKVIGYGYYWEGQDPLKNLSTHEEKEVLELALMTSQRFNVPYIAIDIGQLENDEWIVIETGDPQFSGVSQIPLLQLWHQINLMG